MYLSVKLTDHKLIEIALAFGVNSVSAISHAYSKINKQLMEDCQLQNQCMNLENRINSTFKT